MSLLMNQRMFPVIPFFGTTADGYLIDIIYETKYDYIINVDEDAYIYDIDVLLSLVEYVDKNTIAACGVPDGGVLPIRSGNPFSLNPFFTIFNAKLVREIKKEDFISSGLTFDCNYKNIPKCCNEHYQIAMNEPYYQFFFAFHAQRLKMLYLERTEYEKGGYADIIISTDGKPFLIHTWYSRLYGKDNATTQYIDDAFEWSVHKAGGRSDVSMKTILRHKLAGLIESFSGKTKDYLRDIRVFAKEIFTTGIRYIKNDE